MQDDWGFGPLVSSAMSPLSDTERTPPSLFADLLVGPRSDWGYGCTGTSEAGCFHLESRDRVLFCVHPAVLRSSSGFFGTTLSLPQGELQEDAEKGKKVEPLQVSESSEVLAILLGVACGRTFHISSLPTIDDFLDVLCAADKYEMCAVVSMIRYAVSSDRSPFMDNPLQFALTCHRYGWADEYRIALVRTLSVDVTSLSVYPKLCVLDGRVVANIHQLRSLTIDRFKTQLFAEVDDDRDASSDREFDFDKNSECVVRRSYVFQRWKWVMLEEFTRFPSGKTLLNPKGVFFATPAVETLFGPYGCRHHSNSSMHDLGLAKLSWMAILRNVLQDVASSTDSILDSCLNSTSQVKRRVRKGLRSAVPHPDPPV